jgi:hypothetical protein
MKLKLKISKDKLPSYLVLIGFILIMILVGWLNTFEPRHKQDPLYPRDLGEFNPALKVMMIE